MRIIFMGSGVFGEPTLRWLAQSGHDVPLVVTQPAKASGRGQRVVRTPIGAVAAELGIEVFAPDNINDAEAIDKLKSVGAHVGLAIAYGQKLSDAVLNAATAGCINLHASLLPKYRGAAPINWAIVRGETVSGCTVFRIVERMDAGPILVMHDTEIAPQETAGELHDRLSVSGVDAVKEALALHEDGAVPKGTPQDDALATTAPKLKKSDGVIDFSIESAAVANHICGMTPWPGATGRFESQEGRWENVTVLRAKAVDDAEGARLSPGTIDGRGYVACGEGFVEILEIKPSSGRVMNWSDYVNGRHVTAGDSFVCLSESA